MREAATISNVSRMRAGPPGPYNALKTKICFGAFFPNNVFYYVWDPLGPWFRGATVGPSTVHKDGKEYKSHRDDGER